MRLILSRKGFDSSNGGCASPILPDGRLLTLPIPSSSGPVRYRELRYAGVDVAALVRDLTAGNHGPDDAAHLDPDLVPNSVPRPPAWRPAFGQVDTAQIHLANQGVGEGDVFLFFGWFRQVQHERGRWRFQRNAPNLHVLFGWLQVGEVLDIVATRDQVLRRHPWLNAHPHLSSTTAPNVVYVAVDRLQLPGVDSGSLPGAGVFQRFAANLVLTRPGQPLRSRWRLPSFFYPREDRPALTYHEQMKRWALEEDGVALQSAGRGQEFVLDLASYPEATTWLVNILAKHGA